MKHLPVIMMLIGCGILGNDPTPITSILGGLGRIIAALIYERNKV